MLPVHKLPSISLVLERSTRVPSSYLRASLQSSFATSKSPTEYPTLSAFLRNLPPFFRRLLHHHEQIASDLEVWRAFRSHTRLETVTDGSLAKQVGTFGWRLLRPPHEFCMKERARLMDPSNCHLQLGVSLKDLLLLFSSLPLSPDTGAYPTGANLGG